MSKFNVNMIQALRFVQDDIGKRGMSHLLQWERDQKAFLGAVEAISNLAPESHIALLTGFPCLLECSPPTETDGINGTCALIYALHQLGRHHIHVLTDQVNANVIAACVALFPQMTISVHVFPGTKAWTAQAQADLEALYSIIQLYIAIERAGAADNGHYYTMRARDMTDIVAPLDQCFAYAQAHGIPTIAIGDGGNELGMGNVSVITKSKIRNGDIIATKQTCDYLIIACISDWGAYSLCAGIAHCKGHHILVPQSIVVQVAKTMADAGARDGILGCQDTFVDGLPLVETLNTLHTLRHYVLEKPLSTRLLGKFGNIEWPRVGHYARNIAVAPTDQSFLLYVNIGDNISLSLPPHAHVVKEVDLSKDMPPIQAPNYPIFLLNIRCDNNKTTASDVVQCIASNPPTIHIGLLNVSLSMLTEVVQICPGLVLRLLGMSTYADVPMSAAPASNVNETTVFARCRHLHLAAPETTTYLPSQSMQRGLAYAKTMMQMQSANAEFTGSSFAQFTLIDENKHQNIARSVPQRGPNPNFTIGIALPNIDLEKATCMIEILMFSSDPKATKFTVLASTTSFPANKLTSASSIEIPLATHAPTNPIDSNMPCIELQKAPSAPVLPSSLPFTRTSSTKYSFPQSLVLQEDIYEADLASSIPYQVLTMAIEETNHQIETFTSYLAISQIQECLFPSQELALSNGCDVYAIHAIRARGLAHATTNTLSSTSAGPQPCTSPATSSRASVVAMAKSMKSQAFSRFKSLQPTTEFVKPVNPYCEVSIKDPYTFDGGAWNVAKTNIITNSPEPIWSIASTGAKIHGYVENDNPQHMHFYRPSNPSKEGFIECKVYSKPPSSSSTASLLRKQAYHSCLGTVKIPLDSLQSTSSPTTFTTAKDEWYRLHQPSTQVGSNCKCDDDETGDGPCTGELLIDLEIEMTSSSYPCIKTSMDDITPRYRWLDTVVCAKEASSNVPYPSTFLEGHLSALKTSLDTLNEVRAVSSAWMTQHLRFKSSQMKKVELVQAMPTNLHVSIASRWLVHDKPIELPTITCGLPAAHCLGLEDMDLYLLDEAIQEASKYIRVRLMGGIPSVHSFLPIVQRADGFVQIRDPESTDDEGSVVSVDTETEADDEASPDKGSIKARAAKSLKERSKMLSSLYSQAKSKAQQAIPVKSISFPKAPGSFPSISKSNGTCDHLSSSSSLMSLMTRLADHRLEYRLRKTMVIAQALPAVISAFLVSLQLCWNLPEDERNKLLQQWRSIGYLCGWESLVSSQGRELHMLFDAWMGLQSMTRTFVFQLVSADVQPQVTLLDTVIQIPLQPDQYSQLPSELLHDTIDVVCVLFTQGINEMQSLANMSYMGGVTKQSTVNTASLLTLNQYREQYASLFGSCCKNSFALLTDAVANENGASKNTEILHLASIVVRGLHGGRVTCCKSGKDRTAMSVTWEQAMWALHGNESDISEAVLTEDDIETNEALKMANLMREFGGRIEIAEKNVGAKRYSFNALQRKLLPVVYRPPVSTIQDMVTSVALRDS
ncbi:inositol-3,4-bisphosphate 4-phosphatase [Thraustotheca clavata]|uniref:Inositol-3,4-bisphosphate 4-phosphatase n=1 Tax=Thraustotheca clavata TaxID=74557 RepID=A0A1V9YZB9_9STRA|nr:inositol-3,4-bisphosphate 4-phosphatase [Thraustotheca clavata]